MRDNGIRQLVIRRVKVPRVNIETAICDLEAIPRRSATTQRVMALQRTTKTESYFSRTIFLARDSLPASMR